jgi:cyanate permease
MTREPDTVMHAVVNVCMWAALGGFWLAGAESQVMGMVIIGTIHSLLFCLKAVRRTSTKDVRH